MGIRFYCPNGHKLNVKSFQAGRRGICPYCGAKIIIPSQSTRKSSKAEAAARGEGDQEIVLQSDPAEPAMPQAGEGGRSGESVSGGAAGRFASMPAGAFPVATPIPGPTGNVAGSSPGSPAAAVGPVMQNPLTPAPIAGAPTPGGDKPLAGGGLQAEPLPRAAEMTQQATSAAPPTSLADAASTDPLAEAGNVVWYVRPPSGGQFGPATSDVMRTWIGEGRVSADSLVWREGWRDWLVAGDVFSQLGAGKNEFEFGGLGNTGPSGAFAHGRTHPPRSRRQETVRQVGIISLLVLAVCVLVGVFVYVAFYYPA